MRNSLETARFFIWIVTAMIAKVGVAARHSHLVRPTARAAAASSSRRARRGSHLSGGGGAMSLRGAIYQIERRRVASNDFCNWPRADLSDQRDQARSDG
jgi:hypothetical protein